MDQVWQQIIHHVESVNKKNLLKLENIIADEDFEKQLDELCEGELKQKDEDVSDQDQNDGEIEENEEENDEEE